ncbi:unnamed protein product [Amoebophrya sp. A120]|nr:unnamed protein product [Amoebophrya sp. A120]|eukprot:GSA120T00015998001.1
MVKIAKIGAASAVILPLMGGGVLAAQKKKLATHFWAGSESEPTGLMEVDRVDKKQSTKEQEPLAKKTLGSSQEVEDAENKYRQRCQSVCTAIHGYESSLEDPKDPRGVRNRCVCSIDVNKLPESVLAFPQ